MPKTPKYEHVQGVIDTGMNVRKVQNISTLAAPLADGPESSNSRLRAATREYLKRKNELFKRVRPSSVYRLLCDHEEKHESIYDIGEEAESGGGFAAAIARGASADESKSSGVQIVTHSADDAVAEVERKVRPLRVAICVVSSCNTSLFSAVPYSRRP